MFMKFMKRGFIGLVFVSILAAVGLQFPVVQDDLIRAGAKRYFAKRAANDKWFTDDALRVVVCGSSAPLPHPDRAKACLAVIAGGKFYLVDIGPEATETFGLHLFPLQRVGAVFITHLHSDHIGELGEFAMQSWANGRDQLLDVYGPPGIETVVEGFNQAYSFDNDYRTAHHGQWFLPREVAAMLPRPIILEGPDTDRKDRQSVALIDGDLTVTAIEINHHVVQPAYAYRFDYKGRSVVISGDTAYHPPLAVAARGADVLFHESNSAHIFQLFVEAAEDMPSMERFSEINRTVNSYHTTPIEAARIANQANVKLLALYHLMPPMPVPGLQSIWLRGIEDEWNGELVVVDDGMVVSLPLGTSEIKVGALGD